MDYARFPARIASLFAWEPLVLVIAGTNKAPRTSIELELAGSDQISELLGGGAADPDTIQNYLVATISSRLLVAAYLGNVTNGDPFDGLLAESVEMGALGDILILDRIEEAEAEVVGHVKPEAELVWVMDTGSIVARSVVAPGLDSRTVEEGGHLDGTPWRTILVGARHGLVLEVWEPVPSVGSLRVPVSVTSRSATVRVVGLAG